MVLENSNASFLDAKNVVVAGQGFKRLGRILLARTVAIEA